MMSDLLFARSQMAVSLGFHIIFAAVGMGMPVLMVVTEGLHLRTGEPVYRELAEHWAKGTAVLFAVGAVSGTVLSFELGLLWPTFMQHAGGVIGMPFSLEGFAFFTEAIFLGLYLYGWDRISPGAHWACGVMVALSGAASAVFVVTANAWMNAPVGFEMTDGRVTEVDPIAAMLNPSSLQQVVHMLLAAYLATAFAVAAVHAWFLLRDRSDRFHRKAFTLALAVAVPLAPLQIVSGDFSARVVSEIQPAKFAAMEAHYQTQRGAPLVIGGIPDDEAMETRWALEIPYGLSLMTHRDPRARVAGLEEVARDEWPPTLVVHTAFNLMVGIGLFLLALAAWAGWWWWRRRSVPDGPRFLKAVILAGPLGFVAIEAGWVVTEVGRQPWVIYQVMRTEEAVTPMSGLGITFGIVTLVYLLLSVILVLVMRRLFVQTRPASASGADAGSNAGSK